MEKWQEALALISQRESEIQEVFHKVTDIKSNVLQLEMEKKEQTAFLDNEKDNVNELQNHVNHVNFVDLVKNFLKNFYLQKSASIQPRRSLLKFI